MLVFILQQTCYNMSVPALEIPTVDNIAFNVILTERGVSQFLNKYVQIVTDNIVKDILLSDIHLPKVAGIEVSLIRGKFANAIISNILVKMLGDSSVSLVVPHLSLDLIFDLQIVQTSFPYLSDSGSLSLIIDNIKFQGIALIQNDPKCGRNIKLITRNTVVSVLNFNMHFKCDMQILLNAVSSFLSGILLEQLNGQLGIALGDILIQGMVGKFLNLPEYASNSGSVTTDQRTIGGIQLGERSIKVSSSGLRCNMKNLTSKYCDGNYTLPVTKQIDYLTNNDVQYQIEKSAFNSGLLMFCQDQSLAEIEENFIFNNIELVRFHNTGATILVNVTLNSKIYILEYLEPITMTIKDIDNNGIKIFAVFEIRLNRNIQSDNLEAEFIQKLETQFNNNFHSFDLTYDSCKSIKKDVTTIYLDENWIHITADVE